MHSVHIGHSGANPFPTRTGFDWPTGPAVAQRLSRRSTDGRRMMPDLLLCNRLLNFAPYSPELCEVAEAPATALARPLPSSQLGLSCGPVGVTRWPICEALPESLSAKTSMELASATGIACGRTASRCADPDAADQAPVFTAGSGTKGLLGTLGISAEHSEPGL